MVAEAIPVTDAKKPRTRTSKPKAAPKAADSTDKTVTDLVGLLEAADELCAKAAPFSGAEGTGLPHELSNAIEHTLYYTAALRKDLGL